MMSSGRYALVLVALAVAPFLTGCQTVSETGRSRLLLTSFEQENQLGLQAWGEVAKSEKPSTNAARIAAVQRVGAALAKVIDAPGFQWEFKVFASDQANAFCLPGGKVAVYEGLFQYLGHDAELAAVVGHEIAHATARHGGERMSQAMAVDLGGAALGAAVGGQAAVAQQTWMMAYAGLTTVGVMLPFSRTHEYEADSIGVLYMARAGYDPEAAVSFWEKFAGKDKKSLGTIGEMLSTHPADAKRIQNLKTLMPKATLEYEGAAVRHGLGQSY